MTASGKHSAFVFCFAKLLWNIVLLLMTGELDEAFSIRHFNSQNDSNVTIQKD